MTIESAGPANPIRLPSARYLVVTWGIPDQFGGMTGAFLHRSRAFVRLGGVPVDIVTFDGRVDYPDVERSLREHGELIDGMRLINVWEWLRENPLDSSSPGSLSSGHVFTPLERTDATHRTAHRDTLELSRTRLADDGETVLQVDHYRTDGTLFASDRRDTKLRGTVGGRAITICDAAGEPVRSFGGAWVLYRYWLDLIRGGESSIVFVDSKTAADFMIGYRRDDATTVHVVHSSHLVGTERPLGTIRPTRKKVFDNLAAFDAVVVLTSRQKDDIETLLGTQPNLWVVPNGRSLTAGVAPALDRPRRHGIVLASLTTRKRLSHAIRAVAEANRTLDDDVTLDIYGDGPERESLQAEIDALGQGATITLRGFDATASERFAAASFMLLTSTSEGLPLVLVESMAAGCIPLSYDITYGPADMITPGVNGYLVPPADHAALARSIVDFVRLDEERVLAMRRDAVLAAEAFTDAAVTRQWAQVLDDVLTAAPSSPRIPSTGQNGAPAFPRLRKIAALARGLRAQK